MNTLKYKQHNDALKEKLYEHEVMQTLHICLSMLTVYAEIAIQTGPLACTAALHVVPGRTQHVQSCI